MPRYGVIALLTLVALAVAGLAVTGTPWWWLLAGPLLALALLGWWDLVQRKHSITRNYPVLGHARFLLEALRPELQQYFIERNFTV